MLKIHIQRNWEVNAPLEWCVENNLDWTHFVHCHRKGIKKYYLLYKSEDREIFVYQARVLWPLPLYKWYVVFRKYEKEEGRYRNIYHDVKSGLNSYLDAWVVKNKDSVSMLSDYLYELPEYWRPFKKLFYWIFKWRMGKLAQEDNVIFAEKAKRPSFFESEQCGPFKPSHLDPFEVFFPKDLKMADAHFYTHTFDDIMNSSNQKRNKENGHEDLTPYVPKDKIRSSPQDSQTYRH